MATPILIHCLLLPPSTQHVPPLLALSSLPALVSVYGQCTVTQCQLVTECRPASEGLGPAYKTTHWLCENVCGVTTSLTNCTMYTNMPH